MADNNIKPMYDGITTASFPGVYNTTNRSPLNRNSVQISLDELKKYINKSTDSGGNAYPGMIIAVDDDMTNGGAGNVENESERGIYYITRDRNDNNSWTYFKLAYKNDLDSTVNDSVEPIVKILNIMLANDCPWDEIYDDQGRQTGPNPVVSINEIQNQAINRRIYRIEPIYKESDNVIHKNWGDNNWNWSDD